MVTRAINSYIVFRILSHGRLSSPTMVKLAQNLWRLATQHGQADKELLVTLFFKKKLNFKGV